MLQIDDYIFTRNLREKAEFFEKKMFFTITRGSEFFLLF